MKSIAQAAISRNYEESARALREEISDLWAKVELRRTAAGAEHCTLVDLGYSSEVARAILATKAWPRRPGVKPSPYDSILGARRPLRRIGRAA